MITHEEFFNRVMAEGDYNYAAVMAVEDAVADDVNASEKEYRKAFEAWAQIKGYSVEKLQAENVMHRAQIEYNEKLIAHLHFLGE